MIKGWWLRRKRDRNINAYNKPIRAARKVGDTELVKKLVGEQKAAERWEETDIDFYESQRVVDLADRLDVKLPDDEQGDCWILGMYEGRVLTSKGRVLVRTWIYEERMRRFELRSRWVKLLTPIIAALAGLIGTITGLVAVLHRK